MQFLFTNFVILKFRPVQPVGWGWLGRQDFDDGDLDFPTELLGLLGLTGLKGLKGLKSVVALGGIPLLPLLFPFLLPLLLPLLLLPLLPLLLLLFIPSPVISTGRKLFEGGMGQSLKNYMQNKMDSIMANLPDDISQAVDQINGFSASDVTFNQLVSKYTSKASFGKGGGIFSAKQKKHLGDKGSINQVNG